MRKSKVYAVMNRKGGVAKTTTAITLGHGLARKGKTVLIVDLDPQGNVSTSLGLTTNGSTISNLLLGELPAEKCIIRAGDHRPGLYVLPANDELADTKIELVAQSAIDNVMRQIRKSRKSKTVDLGDLLIDRLAKPAAAFDYIIIDCPPSLDMLSDSVFNFADEAIVPVRPDYLGATGTAQHTRNIIEAQAEGIEIRIGWVLPTFFRAREVLAREVLESLKRNYGNRVAPPIPQNVAIEQAPASGGKTIWEYDPECPAALAYQELVELVYE